ncbi:MAG: hypothetical protein QW325_04265 [Nitrososphaerota archaeon]
MGHETYRPQKLCFFRGVEYSSSRRIIVSEEDELIKGVEEEVRKLLAERKMERAQGKPALSIHYFGSPDEVRDEDLEAILRSGAVLIALKDRPLDGARRFLEYISQVVKRAGGSIYLVKSPSILIIGGPVKLEIRG